MTSRITSLVAALVLGIAGPALADSQLIASAGLDADAAAGLSLNQIAAAKANVGVSYADRQAVVIERKGSNAALAAFAVSIANSGESYSDRQPVRQNSVAVSTRSVAGDPGAWSQLIASAGLTTEQAQGLTLNQIVAAKVNRDRSYSDRQLIRN